MVREYKVWDSSYKNADCLSMRLLKHGRNLEKTFNYSVLEIYLQMEV